MIATVYKLDPQADVKYETLADLRMKKPAKRNMNDKLVQKTGSGEVTHTLGRRGPTPMFPGQFRLLAQTSANCREFSPPPASLDKVVQRIMATRFAYLRGNVA
jgi:hypothetical protein